VPLQFKKFAPRGLVYGVSGREPTDEQIAHIKAGRMASGVNANAADVQWKLQATKMPTAYVEMVWSADKSVSAAWALAGTEAERALIQHAHRDATEFAMAYASDVLGHTRRGAEGDRIEKGATAWFSVMHFTSRPTAGIARTDEQGHSYTEFQAVPVRNADPQLHTHSILLNAVLTPDGHIGSMDLDQLAGRVHEFGAVYQARLAQTLRTHGIGTHLDPDTGAARITAIPDSVRRHFSKRSLGVQDSARAFAREAGQDWDALNSSQQLPCCGRVCSPPGWRRNTATTAAATSATGVTRPRQSDTSTGRSCGRMSDRWNCRRRCASGWPMSGRCR
jgi:hypothetical protein